MQNFIAIPSTETLANSRQKLLDNDSTIMSNNSGTAFPTTNIQVGMTCFRTDQNKEYQLKDLTPTWIMTRDFTKTATDKEYVDTALALKVDDTEVATVATANKLLKLDGTGKLPASITGNAATATTATTATTAGTCSGNSTTASRLATARTINGVFFDGTSNISLNFDDLVDAPDLDSRFGVAFFYDKTPILSEYGTYGNDRIEWTKGNAIGATSIACYATSVKTIKAGQKLRFQGHNQVYTVTSDCTSSTTVMSIPISPALVSGTANVGSINFILEPLSTILTTWTVPVGVTKCHVTVVGGGGGGGRGSDGVNGGWGGSGQVKYRHEVTNLTPGSIINITVGKGGDGSEAHIENAQTGGISSFGSYVSATGGSPGVYNINGNNCTDDNSQSPITQTFWGGTIPHGSSYGVRIGGHGGKGLSAYGGYSGGGRGASGMVMVEW